MRGRKLRGNLFLMFESRAQKTFNYKSHLCPVKNKRLEFGSAAGGGSGPSLGDTILNDCRCDLKAPENPVDARDD